MNRVLITLLMLVAATILLAQNNVNKEKATSDEMRQYFEKQEESWHPLWEKAKRKKKVAGDYWKKDPKKGGQ